MAQFSPAVLNYAISLLKALLTPSRGRHSTAHGRRRRSGRVRRYAPLPDPALARAGTPIASPPAPLPGPPPTPRRVPPPAPRLARSPAPIPAEEVALVRGYYRAFEQERDLARVQADALARLNRWTSGPAPTPIPRPRPVPAGDLLAPTGGLGEPRAGAHDRVGPGRRVSTAV
ncbi:hypothetical protein ACFXKD_11545 [Nocardiopsis aegyptia]|uniref:hypothetical protein n=1 Tax=Nocardiopsis aegyptia TaxID=220378 RepID=UPI00366D96C7